MLISVIYTPFPIFILQTGEIQIYPRLFPVSYCNSITGLLSQLFIIKWANKMCSDQKYSRLKKFGWKNWLNFLYRHDCPKCKKKSQDTDSQPKHWSLNHPGFSNCFMHLSGCNVISYPNFNKVIRYLESKYFEIAWFNIRRS